MAGGIWSGGRVRVQEIKVDGRVIARYVIIKRLNLSSGKSLTRF